MASLSNATTANSKTGTGITITATTSTSSSTPALPPSLATEGATAAAATTQTSTITITSRVTTTLATPTTPPTSDQSEIEEEIEEAIEMSDDEVVDSAKNTTTNSDRIDVFATASTSKEGGGGVTAANASDLFGIGDGDSDDDDDEEISRHGHPPPRSNTTEENEQFKIDDEELSGGNIAQHFVVDDDDDDDDDEDDDDDDGGENINLNKVKVHSRHEDDDDGEEELPNVSLDSSKRRKSLIDDSTTDDVSDFVEEEEHQYAGDVDVDVDIVVKKDDERHKDMDLPLPDSVENGRNLQEAPKIAADDDALSEAASSEHGEKDHSIEEFIASNDSIIFETHVQREETKELPVITTDLDDSHEKNMIEQASTSTSIINVVHDDDDGKRATEIQISTSSLDNNNVKIHFHVDDETEMDGGESEDDGDGGDRSLELFKMRILAMKDQEREQEQEEEQQTSQDIGSSGDTTSTSTSQHATKPMERIPLTEFSKDILEDITEESERNSLSTNATINPDVIDPQSSSSSVEKSMQKDFVDNKDESIAPTTATTTSTSTTTTTSIVSLNMIKVLEQRVSDLQEILASKDACLASLNLQLESSSSQQQQKEQPQQQQHHRDSSNGATEQPYSGRDSSSLMTNSTEYRTLQEEFIGPTTDLYAELSKRDELIAKLTESLQQSLSAREQLQLESERLSNEVQGLRKQLTDINPDVAAAASVTQRRSLYPNYWLRADQESNAGQRISEISMDLVSETDDDLDEEDEEDLERNFLTDDNEDKMSHNSRERQLSMPRQMSETSDVDQQQQQQDAGAGAFTKQIEQFQKYLTPSEVRLFYMVQKKFDDYLGQELEKCRSKYESEYKIVLDRLEGEKQEKEQEIKRLKQLRDDSDTLHSKEMENLRKYFEAKCADLEKQYSDDVFSQKSQRVDTDSSSESSSSDGERMPEETVATATGGTATITTTPTAASVAGVVVGGSAVSLSANSTHLRSKENSPRKRTRAELLLSPSHRQMTPCGDAIAEDLKDANLITEVKSFYQQKLHEIQRNHEMQVRKLNEKLKYYETRYPEDDFMNLLSETTTDDLHWPPELILLREKLTAKSQLEIAQLQMKHEEEMSRVKQDYEKQKFLQRQKNMRRSIYEMGHDTLLAQVCTERDQLRQLLKSFHQALSGLAKCVEGCEDEANATLNEQVQRLLLNVTIEQHQQQQQTKTQTQVTLTQSSSTSPTPPAPPPPPPPMSPTELQFNLSSSINMFNAKGMRILPDVQTLLEVVDSPTLVQFINSNDDNELMASQFDLKECMQRLNEEANYILELTEKRQRARNDEESMHDEKLDDGCDILASERKKESMEATTKQSKRRNAAVRRCSSFNDGGGGGGRDDGGGGGGVGDNALIRFAQALSSMPANFQYLGGESNDNGGGESSNATTPGAGQHNPFQVLNEIAKLKTRLVESENDRQKLQSELENTIIRNSELGQELKSLRDRISQLNSLNHIDYAEGYGLGALKTPTRSSSIDGGGGGVGIGVGGGVGLAIGLENDAILIQTSIAQLQERARHILTSPPTTNNTTLNQSMQKSENLDTSSQQDGSEMNDFTILLLQTIEDFCRESDRLIDTNKRERDDLQAQIDAADKKLKATRKFVEEQAAERELERDEFTREIDRLKCLLRDKERDMQNILNKSRELEQYIAQFRNQKDEIAAISKQRDKLEGELKASINKIFDLREIIAELESRIEEKELGERVMADKIKQLQSYINSQNQSNETLQNEVISLKTEIDTSYHDRIRALEKKLQNVRPTAEQFAVMEHIVEQLHDIEATLDQKTKMLESLHHSGSSNSCSHSATEDVSAQAVAAGAPAAAAIPAQISDLNSPIHSGSPVHPSPRQHSLTMEGVQRVIEKLAKHTRVEEAALKRIRDLEMQVTQMCAACVELQQERDTLQERMSEQSQRISALQMRLDEQRQRADDLQRIGTSDLNIRIHDLQTEVKELNEKLNVRDKQMSALKQQLDKSKNVIHRLEAELSVQQQPDRSAIARLESELALKQQEIQKLKNTIKNEMINKQHLPDLMETMLADKNDEIDLLREQYELKVKELSAVLEQTAASSSSSTTTSPSSSAAATPLHQGSKGGGAAVDSAAAAGRHNDDDDDVVAAIDVGAGGDAQQCSKSARTLSDIISIVEYDEPDVMRRAVMISPINQATPLTIVGAAAANYNTMDTSKEAIANLTHKRTEELSRFAASLQTQQQQHTFDDPRYFHERNTATTLLKTTLLGSSNAATETPTMQPRQINFSDLSSEDSKLKTTTSSAAAARNAELEAHLDSLEKELQSARHQLAEMQEQLSAGNTAITKLDEANAQLAAEQARSAQLKTENEKLTQECEEKGEMLTKHEKELLNLRESESELQQRIQVLEADLLSSTDERAKLHLELNALKETHERDAEKEKIECERLNVALKARDERLEQLNRQLTIKEERIKELNIEMEKSNEQIKALQKEADRLQQHQQHQQQQQQHLNSDNSSKLFSVEEIAQQVEKELNYSAQLDSNILKAIESEEENNLDLVHLDKSNQTSVAVAVAAASGDDVAAAQQATDDENFTGERELLNQLEALRAQIAVERERNDAMRRELFAEKQHSQDVQEQDIAVLSALRKRLEKAIEQEDDLHKQLDLERERYECLQAQYTALQRAESRRNSALLLKSPTESPRKAAGFSLPGGGNMTTVAAERTVRSLGDFGESDAAERLRSEIKMLTAQNERERERCVDVQRNSEREFARYKTELNERKEYCEQLNREMAKVQRERDNAQQECEHLQERLTLQSQEIESLEWRLATLQEAEAQRAARRERYQKESAELLAEMQELKAQALATEAEREASRKLTAQLRTDLERSAERERKLADSLAQARENMATAAGGGGGEESVPLKLLQNEIEVKRQMAETLQLLTEERCRLQSKCEELEKQLGNRSSVQELEERCKQLLGRYLRIDSYRKALVYQKRYLKLSLLSYEAGERSLAVLRGKVDILDAESKRYKKKKLFKTVAIAVIAIQRMKYIVNVWRSGKRIVSKSTFTITQQKRSPIPSIVAPPPPPSPSVPIVSSTTSPSARYYNNSDGVIYYNNNNNISNNNNNNNINSSNTNNNNMYNYNNNSKKVTSNGKVK